MSNQTNATAPDWTPEPWHDDKGYRIYGPITPGIDGPHHPERWLLCEFKHFDGQPGDSARAVECVNVMGGYSLVGGQWVKTHDRIPDPAAFVRQAKEAAAAVKAERERCIAWLDAATRANRAAIQRQPNNEHTRRVSEAINDDISQIRHRIESGDTP